MNTIVSVTPTQGVGKNGKPFVRYDVVLDNGVTASGFDAVIVGEQVDVIQKGKYVNYLKAGAGTPPLPLPGVVPPAFIPPAAQPPLERNGYWEQKDQRDREWRAEQVAQQPKIMRQHSQEMALRWFAIMGGIPGEVSEYTKKLRAMIDWFQRDIDYSPELPERKSDEMPEEEGPPI